MHGAITLLIPATKPRFARVLRKREANVPEFCPVTLANLKFLTVVRNHLRARRHYPPDNLPPRSHQRNRLWSDLICSVSAPDRPEAAIVRDRLLLKDRSEAVLQNTDSPSQPAR